MSLENQLDTPLAIAVRAAGSQSAFGRWIKRRQSTVFGWLKDDRPLPAEHVLEVERLSGISRTTLRPDIYPQHEALPPNGKSMAGVSPDPSDVRCNSSSSLPPEPTND